MNFSSSLKQDITNTPAFVYHLDQIEKKIKLLCQIRERSGCKILYSVKALPLCKVLKKMKPLERVALNRRTIHSS